MTGAMSSSHNQTFHVQMHRQDSNAMISGSDKSDPNKQMQQFNRTLSSSRIQYPVGHPANTYSGNKGLMGKPGGNSDDGGKSQENATNSVQGNTKPESVQTPCFMATPNRTDTDWHINNSIGGGAVQPNS